MKLQKRVQVLVGLSLLCILAAGCIFSPKNGGNPGTTKKILPRTSPDNVRNNIEATYELRDVAEYDSLLSSGYIFRFQPGDITPGQADTLPRGDELSFAEHLFVTGVAGINPAPAASSIKLTITTAAIADDNRIGHTGWKKYTVTTALTLSFPNADELTVNSPATLYFKQEPAGSGLWKLGEWKDEIASAPDIRLALR